MTQVLHRCIIAGVMRRGLHLAGLTAMWFLALVTALTSARYLLVPPKLLLRRFDAHREWMTRNYSLTFAAATVRLAAFPLLILTRDPVVAVTWAFWSWMLTLGVAEWLIRRRAISLDPMAQTPPTSPPYFAVPSSLSGVSFPPK